MDEAKSNINSEEEERMTISLLSLALKWPTVLSYHKKDHAYKIIDCRSQFLDECCSRVSAQGLLLCSEMFGEKALDLLRELKRAREGTLPPYAEDTVRQVSNAKCLY